MSSSMSTKRTVEALVVRELEPRRDVRVVVELACRGSRRRAARSRPAVRESAKLSVVMFGPKTTSSAAQPRKRPAVSRAAGVERLGAAARLVRAARVRVRRAEVVGDGVDHLVRAPASRRAPSKRTSSRWSAREPGADGGDVEAHAACTSQARAAPPRARGEARLPVHSGTSRAVSASGRNVSPAATARSRRRRAGTRRGRRRWPGSSSGTSLQPSRPVPGEELLARPRRRRARRRRRASSRT